jgi:hypothetical protein
MTLLSVVSMADPFVALTRFPMLMIIPDAADHIHRR